MLWRPAAIPLIVAPKRVLQVRGLFAFLLAAQKLYLDQAHGIDVRVAQADGAGEHAIFRQQLPLAENAKKHTA